MKQPAENSNVAKKLFLCSWLLLSFVARHRGQATEGSCVVPSPAQVNVMAYGDLNGWIQPGSGKPVTPEQLQAPQNETQIELQATGSAATATQSTVEEMRSVLADALKLQVPSVAAVAVKNVTSCAALPAVGSPAAAPGSPSLDLGSTQAPSRRRLLAHSLEVQGRSLLASTIPAPHAASSCIPKMRAIFTLAFGPEINNSSTLIREAVSSGMFVARLKIKKVNITGVELLALSQGGSLKSTSTASLQGGALQINPWTQVPAPAPGYLAKAPTLADTSILDVLFTLVLTGRDADESNGDLLKAIWQLLTGSVDTENADCLTIENTALTTVQQLAPVTFSVGGRRRVLQVASISASDNSATGCSNLPSSACLQRRSLATGTLAPDVVVPLSDTPVADAVESIDTGPVLSLALTYKVAPVPEQGLAITKTRLVYFVQTGQMMHALQNQSFQIDYVQLENFTTVSGASSAPAPAPVPAPTPAPTSTGTENSVQKALAPAPPAPSMPFSVQPAQPSNAQAPSLGTPSSGIPTSMIAAAACVSGAVGLGACAAVIWLLVRRRRGARVDGGGTLGRSFARSTLPSSRPGQLSKSSASMGYDDYQSTLNCASVTFERRSGGDLWLLGQGKFGKVYKGRFLKQLVAIKVLTDNSPEQQEAFQHETLLMRNLRHPHIVQYLGHTQLDGNMLLIMEFMQGGTLAAAIAADNKNSTRRLAWHRQGLEIALGVASGLHYLHSKRVIWFDCKSQNILLDSSGKIAKISDVGISKTLLNTCTQAFMRGTVGYLAPELVPQLCGAVEDGKEAFSGVSHAVDIYSFGIVLWEIITGENPQKCNGCLRTPRVPEECSADAVKLYQQCLMHKINQRPTIETVLQKLHAEKSALCAFTLKA